jgi:hypothetical protein
MSKPVAYAAVAADGSESSAVYLLKEQADAAAREWGWFVVPLYAAPPTWQEDVAAVEAAFERSGVQPTWPDDEAGNVGPMAEAMADEIGRLRNGATCPHVRGTVTQHCSLNFTIADEEREAVERAIDALTGVEDWSADVVDKDRQAAATIRNLLARLS